MKEGKRPVRQAVWALAVIMVGSAAAHPLAGQTMATDAKNAVTEGFRSVAEFVQQAAEAVAESDYGYRPTAEVRSFGALIAHIVDGHRYYCAHARGSAVEWSDAVERQAPERAEVVRLLRASIADCTAALAAAEVGLGPMIDNLAHTSLHYGNLVTYLRELGITPPSTQPR